LFHFEGEKSDVHSGSSSGECLSGKTMTFCFGKTGLFKSVEMKGVLCIKIIVTSFQEKSFQFLKVTLFTIPTVVVLIFSSRKGKKYDNI